MYFLGLIGPFVSISGLPRRRHSPEDGAARMMLVSSGALLLMPKFENYASKILLFPDWMSNFGISRLLISIFICMFRANVAYMPQL